jgi:hypothetical protein
MLTPSLALTRTVIGILQGIFLYWLYHATEAKSWPATDPYAFAMMVTAGATVPLLAIDGLGHLRPRTLGLWLVFATLLACGVAGYGVYRDANLALSLAQALFVIFFIFFIMQSLIVAGESEGRIIASYPRYFDVSWTLGVQFVLALLLLVRDSGDDDGTGVFAPRHRRARKSRGRRTHAYADSIVLVAAGDDALRRAVRAGAAGCRP